MALLFMPFNYSVFAIRFEFTDSELYICRMESWDGKGGMKLILRIIYVPFEIPFILVTLFGSNIPVQSTDFRVKQPGKQVSVLKHQKRKRNIPLKF